MREVVTVGLGYLAVVFIAGWSLGGWVTGLAAVLGSLAGGVISTLLIWAINDRTAP